MTTTGIEQLIILVLDGAGTDELERTFRLTTVEASTARKKIRTLFAELKKLTD